MIPRPDPSEYAPFYHTYFSAVPDGDLLETLRTSVGETMALLDAAGEARAGHRYAEGKWSVRQVAGHLADTERVMAYRALRAARGDRTPLPGFDENAWVAGAGFEGRTLASLADELAHVRIATLDLLRPLGADELARAAVANGAPVTVRALAWIVAGHEMHHRRILRERYGLSAG
jgi:uncharacterized damage-inducible protein DinB